jgi:hypothetical protein
MKKDLLSLSLRLVYLIVPVALRRLSGSQRAGLSMLLRALKKALDDYEEHGGDFSHESND